MEVVAQVILCLIGLVIFVIALLFALPSFFRHEIRAGITGLAGSFSGAALMVFALLPVPGHTILAGALVGLGIACAVLFVLRIGKVEQRNERPSVQVDERTIMFSRWRLKPDSPQYTAYYHEHPEHKDMDDAMRALPGLLSPSAPLAEPQAFAAANVAFFLAELLRDAVDGPIAATPQRLSPEAASRYLKHLGRYFGARNSGIAEVRDYQVYSHVGRGSGAYSEPIQLNHRYVAVFTFEMAEEMVRTAPRAPEAMETAHQYSEAAQTAVQVAAWIRAMGYEARAHIDGNYRLILPLAGPRCRAGRNWPDGIAHDPRPGSTRALERGNHQPAPRARSARRQPGRA